MRSFCQNLTSGKEEENNGNEGSASLLPSNTHARMFAQQNLHDIPGEKLNELTAKERSEGFYDLHGVSSPLAEETSDFISEKLGELNAAMFRVEEREAFEYALATSPAYVRSLRLCFLRAENYNVSKAASRMALHFDLRRTYFGDSALGRDLRLSDLPECDRKLMGTGYLQLCARRDRGGRALITQILKQVGKEPPPESAIRIFFWLVTFASKEELTQKKGVVLVEYMVGFRTEQLISTKQRSRLPLFLQAFTAIPVRLCALQVCFEDERFRPLFSILTGLMDARGLCRMVSHFGSDAECLHSLMTFGIPPTTLPIRTDGTVDTTEHLRMLSRQAVEEGLSCSFTEDAPAVLRGKEDMALVTDPPEPHDILMGRGKHGSKWPGNLQLRKLLEAHRDDYRKGRKTEKVAISHKIYNDVVKFGSRFLVPSKDSTEEDWTVMERTEVCSRISHMLRNMHAVE